MGSICAEQHKLFPSHQLLSPKKSSSAFKDLEIPPRKLLHSKKSHQDHNIMSSSLPYEFEYSNLRKYLPYNDNTALDKEGTTGNNDDTDEDELDPYSSDHFRMYEFKVRRCTRSRSHDWTDCPFAHPGEKARRRDPRRYHYSGTVCPEFRRGGCSRGDKCECSHGVFECWLHPSRYRTEACKDGRNCKRKVCFFAHTPRQLRLLPELLSSSSAVKYDKSSCLHHLSPCRCLVCHSVTSSPTSTLLGMSHLSPPLSPSLSPPLSPMKHRSSPVFSPISRYNDRLSKFRSGTGCYKDALTELMDSLEAMSFNESAASPLSNVSSSNNTNPWIDTTSFGGVDQDQTQFILSPSTPAASELSNRNRGGNNFPINDGNNYCFSKRFVEENNGVGSSASHDPDLGWVNDLLM